MQNESLFSASMNTISSVDHLIFRLIIKQLRNVICHNYPAFFGLWKFCVCRRVWDVAVEIATFPLSFFACGDRSGP